MAELFDPITGKRVNIEDEAKEAAFLSGKYAVDSSKPVYLNSPDGEAFKVEPQMLQQALASGWRFESALDQAKREYRTEVRESPIASAVQTAAINFGDELLLGVPDFALDLQKEEYDPKSKQLTLKAKRQILREENPTANLIGGATGFTLSLPYGGPLLGAVTKTGQVAERGILQVAKVAGKEAAENIATRAIAKAGNYAAQGAVASTPYVATALALGEPEAAAEVLIAGAGMGIAAGAAGELISPIAGALKTARLPDSEKASAYLRNLARGQGLKSLGFNTAEFRKIVEIERKIAGNPRLSRDEGMETFYDFVHKDLGVSKKVMRQLAPRELEEKFSTWVTQVEQSRAKLLDEMDRAAPNGIIDFDEPLSAFQQLRKQYLTNVGESTGQLAQVDEAFGAVVDAYANKLRKEGIEIAEPGKKATLDDLTNYAANNPVPKLTLSEMDNARKMARDVVFQRGNARSQAASDAYSIILDIIEANGNLVTGAVVQTPKKMAKVAPSAAAKPDIVIDPDGALVLSNNLPARPSTDIVQFKRGDLSTIPPEQRANAGFDSTKIPGDAGTRFRQNGKDMQRAMSYRKMIDDAAARNESARLISPWEVGTGAAAGSVTAGAGAFVLRQYGGRAGEAALFGAAKVIDKVGDRVTNSINRAIGADKEPLRRAAKLGSINVFGKLFDGDDSDRDKRQKLQIVGAELARLQQSPELLNQAVSAFTQDLADLKDGDQVATHYATKVADGIAYLANSIPKPAVPNTPFSNRPFVPTDRELSQFERRIQAVLDPVSVLDEIADGTATKEQMEAMRVVYPQFHKVISDKIIERVSSTKQPIPEVAKRKLLMLIEPQGSQLINPQRAAQLQSNFAPKEKAKPRANSKITESSRGLTDIDRIIYDR